MSEKQKIKELEFKLRKLENFIFNHHHRLYEIGDEPNCVSLETSKPKVWVQYPDGTKEEPKEE